MSLPLSLSNLATAVSTCARSSTRPRALQAVFERKLSRPRPGCAYSVFITPASFFALPSAAPELSISFLSMELRVCKSGSMSCTNASLKRVLPVNGEKAVVVSSYSNMVSSWSSSKDLNVEMAVPGAKEARGPAASCLLEWPCLRMLERSLC